MVYAAQAAAPPVLTYMYAPIEVLDSFTYLGVDISSRRAFAAASIGRAASAQRAALALQHRCHDLSLHDPALQLHLFDALVRPVMLYGGGGRKNKRKQKTKKKKERKTKRRESKHGGRGRCVAVAWILVSLSIGSSLVYSWCAHRHSQRGGVGGASVLEPAGRNAGHTPHQAGIPGELRIGHPARAQQRQLSACLGRRKITRMP